MKHPKGSIFIQEQELLHNISEQVNTFLVGNRDQPMIFNNE